VITAIYANLSKVDPHLIRLDETTPSCPIKPQNPVAVFQAWNVLWGKTGVIVLMKIYYITLELWHCLLKWMMLLNNKLPDYILRQDDFCA
jgi:hypothetical protein